MYTFTDPDTKRKASIYDFIEENGIATSNEIDLVTAINGYNEETLMDIVLIRTGNRTLAQCAMDGYQVPQELLD